MSIERNNNNAEIAVTKDPSSGAVKITDIPGDETSNPLTLTLSYMYGDTFLNISDPTFTTDVFLQNMRFRSSLGGGALPLITEELSRFAKSFDQHPQGQIPNNEVIFDTTTDRIRSDLDLEVISSPDEEPIRTINSIPADEGPESSKFLDIVVFSDGKVVIIQRDVVLEMEGSMTFNATGKYPIVAAVFARIAERIVNAV